MVDVSSKRFTKRSASASCTVTLPSKIVDRIFDPLVRLNDKGDILGISKTAGIMAAKKTFELIPMCHQIPISSVSVDISRVGLDSVKFRSSANAYYSTGVEMEALTAVSIAALTFYDMTKSAIKGTNDKIIIREIQLDYKSGGISEESEPS